MHIPLDTFNVGSLWECLTPEFSGLPFYLGGIYRMDKDDEGIYFLEYKDDKRYPGENYGWPLSEFMKDFRRVL